MPGEFERESDPVGHEPTPKHHSPRADGNGNGGGIPSGSGLGKYRILERIRSTYNATVYKARDTLLDRLVAIKQLTPALMDNPMACGDFRREAQMMARFTGDARHVIGIHELIEEQQGLFIIHEYVEGRWLESHVAKREIDGDRSLRVFGTLAMGIRTLHSLGIVHRDIRPPNVIVSPGLGAKIVDLSCAGAEGDHGSTPTGSAKYCAPEFLLGDAYDDRIDIYSLGMVMYEVFVGRIHLHDYFSAIVADPRASESKWRDWHCEYDLALPGVADINPSIPRPLSNLVARMTAKRVDERIASINEVINALTRILRDRRMDASRRLTGSPARDVGAALPSGEFTSPASSGRLLTGASGAAYGSPRPAVQPWQTTTSIPTMPRTLGPAQAVSNPVSMAGAAAFRATASTTRHRVRADAARTDEKPNEPVASASQATRPTAPAIPIQYATPRRTRRPTASAAARPRIAIKANIPTPEPVEERIKPVDMRRVVRIAAAIVLMVALSGVGGYVAYRKWGPGAHEPIVRLLAGGRAAFAEQNYAAARTAFDQARLDASLADVDTLRHDAEHWMLLVDAAIYITQERFDEAEGRLKEAVLVGADGVTVDTLRDRIYRRKDQIRLQKEIAEDLKRGDVIAAERRLQPYDNAAASPALVEEYKEKIERTRRDGKYEKHIDAATAQMERGDFQAALLSVNNARRLRNGQEVDDLEKRITDRRARADWINSANKALTEHDYDLAIEHYERANRLEASPMIELAIKQANAYKLMRDARAAYAAGNILSARQMLVNSLWSFRTEDAASMLDKMGEEIAAAEQERQADQDADRGEFDSAISKYEWAMLKLKDPANARVRTKLAQTRRAKMVAQADQLYQAREYQSALNGYLEAQKLGEEDPEITAKILKARQRLPR